MKNHSSISASSANPCLNSIVIDLANQIIGCLIQDFYAIERVDDVLEVDLFPLESQQIVVRVIKDLHQQQKRIDLMTVLVELTQRGDLKRIGGQVYLANLLAKTVSAVNIDQYLWLLIEAMYNPPAGDGKISRSKALKLVEEFYQSDRTDEELVLDIADLREKVGMSTYDWKNFIQRTVDKCKKARYRLDLKRLLLIEDQLEKSIEIDDVCKNYRKSRRIVEKDLALMAVKTEQTALNKPRLAIEYDRLETPPLPYLIPDFLPSGVSVLLSGLSGTAKTQFMLDIADSLLESQEFLGLKPSKRSKVLLLITDQSQAQSMAYLRNKGIDLNNPNLALWFPTGDTPGFTINELKALREFIEEFQPDFIGADSLRSIICHPTGVSENEIEIGRYLNKLIAEATRRGSTFLLTHHENKSTEFKGVAKSSGSGDIPARFDIHWRLEKPFEDKEVRKFLTAKTRSASRSGMLNLNVDECRFELERWDMASPEFSQALSGTISRVSHLLSLNPQGLAIWDIEAMMKEVGSPVSTRTIRRCLAQMTASQSIGRKQHPTRQRAFLYYKLPPDDRKEILSSDTSNLLCYNPSNPTESPDIQAQITVTPTVRPTVTSDDLTVTSTTVSPQSTPECHTTETTTESEVEKNCKDLTVPSTTVSPQSTPECHTTETTTESEVENNCDNCDTENKFEKKSVVQTEEFDADTTDHFEGMAMGDSQIDAGSMNGNHSEQPLNGC